MSKGFEGTRGVAQVHVDSGHLRVVVRVGMTPVAEMWMTGLPEAERVANARCMAEAITAASETGLTPRQLAEQRAELLERLEILTAACEEEFCGEGTEAIEPDDSKVAFPEDQCHITFGMIRSARAAIANATQQRNATGGEG